MLVNDDEKCELVISVCLLFFALSNSLRAVADFMAFFIVVFMLFFVFLVFFLLTFAAQLLCNS